MKIVSKHILWLFASIFLLSSCLKDKGNYEYSPLANFLIDTAGAPKTFEVLQSAQNLVISPKIVFEGDESELRYQWLLYNIESATSVKFDTLSKAKVLSVPITYKPGTYQIELMVTRSSNKISKFARYTVTVLPSVSTGWMVAYEKGTGSDIDVIRAAEFIPNATDVVLRNVYSKASGGPLDGSPIAVTYVNANASYLFTTKTGVMLENTDLGMLQPFNTLFASASPPTVVKPEYFAGGGQNKGFFVNNGEIFWFDADIIIGKVTLDLKGYRAAPFTYPQTAKYSGFYDQLNMRFAVVEPFSSQGTLYTNANAGARFNLNNIGKELLYLERGYGATGNGSTGSTSSTNSPFLYAVFKDPADSKRYLYVINTFTPATPDVAMVDITSAPDITNAKFYANGNLGPCFLYATNNRIYNFIVSASSNTISAPNVSFNTPAGEEITCMKLFKGEGTYGSGAITSANESKMIFVATWNSSTQKAKVYLYAVNITDGTLGAVPLKTWEVEGKVKVMGYKQV